MRVGRERKRLGLVHYGLEKRIDRQLFQSAFDHEAIGKNPKNSRAMKPAFEDAPAWCHDKPRSNQIALWAFYTQEFFRFVVHSVKTGLSASNRARRKWIPAGIRRNIVTACARPRLR